MCSPTRARTRTLGIYLGLLSLLLLTGGRPAAHAQDTVIAPTPGAGLDPGQLQTAPDQVLGGNVQAQQLPSDVLHVSPQVLARLQRETPTLPSESVAETTAADSVRIYSSRLSREVERLDGAESAERSLAAEPDPGVSTDRGTRYVLPVRAMEVRTRTEAPETASGSSSRITGVFRPEIETPPGGLLLSRENDRFSGVLQLGVRDSMNPTARRDLPSPVDFQVTAAGATVEPSTVQIRQTNIPYEEIRIAARQIRDSVLLTVRTSLTPGAIRLPIEIRRTAMTVHVTPTRSIPGFGLGTAQITVDVDRLGVGAVEVDLRARLGTPRPDRIGIGESTVPERARIRSTGMGTDTVTASAPGFRSASATIEYVFPFYFLLATLLGGLAGSGLKYLQGSGTEGDSDRGLTRHLVGGLLAGLVVGIASTVGVYVLGVTFTAQYGEALFFTIAALGAYGWESVDLTRVLNR